MPTLVISTIYPPRDGYVYATGALPELGSRFTVLEGSQLTAGERCSDPEAVIAFYENRIGVVRNVIPDSGHNTYKVVLELFPR